MMDDIVTGLAMPLVILIALLFGMILFREPLQDLLRSTSIIRFGKGRVIKFHEGVMRAKRGAKGITATVAASGHVSLPDPAQNQSMLQARDVVLGAWGSLKQIVYDACAAKSIPLTPSSSPLHATASLYQADWISSEVVALIDLLYELAQELAADTAIRPDPKDAGVYAGLANDVLNWIMINVLPAENREDGAANRKVVVEFREEANGRRQTVVSGDFRPPAPGNPTAVLVGIGGPARGRQYAIEQTQVQVGADHGSDLLISNDQYVSSQHAMLRYEQDNLFLWDKSSRNGTFLNENPVTSSAMLVRAGDRIRFGQSEFQVSVTGSPPATREIAGASAQPPVR